MSLNQRRVMKHTYNTFRQQSRRLYGVLSVNNCTFYSKMCYVCVCDRLSQGSRSLVYKQM